MKMRIRGAAVFALLVPAMASPAIIAASNGSGCRYSTDAIESWEAFLSRELHQHDPSHAVQMSKVAAAIIEGRAHTVKAKLAAGLDPNTLLKLGRIPALDMPLLTLAAAACQNDVARQLVAAGASMNPADPPLATAAAKGDVALAAFLIDHGASIGAIDPDGQTALDNALAQSQFEMVKLLLAKGAKPDAALIRLFIERDSRHSSATDRAIADELRKHQQSKH